MSLTEALRAGAPHVFGVLYDEHAERLYAYCHIMVGEEAADAVRDAFIAVARHPGTAPDDDALPVWLYALARAECVRRGALVRRPAMPPSADPLRRALARLRPEHREVLALSTALEPDEIARVIGVAADTAEMLVRVSERRLEQAAASVLGARPVDYEAMLAALSGGSLHTLVMRGYEVPPRQRERVLYSCAAAERAADGALLFDQDGMSIPLDGLFGTAEDPTHPFAKVTDLADEPTDPMREVDAKPLMSPASSASSVFEPRRTSRDGGAHGGHARPKKGPFLSRRRDGLVEVAGLAACVAAATGVLALWPNSPDGNGASNMDGTSVFLHRGAPASRSAQPTAPTVSEGTPPQGATSKPGTSPTPKTARDHTAPDPAAATPPATTTPDQPGGGTGPSHPTPPPHDSPPNDPPHSDPPSSDPPTSDPSPSDPPATTTPTPTPAPSDTPTDPGSDSPAPDPSTS